MVFKRALILFVALLVSLSTINCSGGYTKPTEPINSTPKKSLSYDIMRRGVEYRVSRGDMIEKISKDPIIKIKSDLKKRVTTVTLISGEAAIIRADRK